jgi:hypothetical protein
VQLEAKAKPANKRDKGTKIYIAYNVNKNGTISFSNAMKCDSKLTNRMKEENHRPPSSNKRQIHLCYHPKGLSHTYKRATKNENLSRYHLCILEKIMEHFSSQISSYKATLAPNKAPKHHSIANDSL